MRAPRASHFLTIPNATVRDPRISRRARGLLVELLSYADGWQTNSDDLADEGKGPEGRDAIRGALRELEGAGYLLRARVRDEGGRWATVCAVYDTPQEPGALPPGVSRAPSDRDGKSVLALTSDDAPAEGQTPTSAPGLETRPSVGQALRTEDHPETPQPPTEPGRLQSTPETGVAGARRRRTARGARAQSGLDDKGPAPAAPSPSAGSCPEHPSQGAAACALCAAERTTEPTETVNAVLAAARAAGAAGRARMAAAPRWSPPAPPRAPQTGRDRLREPESAREAS